MKNMFKKAKATKKSHEKMSAGNGCGSKKCTSKNVKDCK